MRPGRARSASGIRRHRQRAGHGTPFTETAGQAWGAATETAEHAWDTAADVAAQTWDTATEVARQAWDTVADTARQVWNDVTDGKPGALGPSVVDDRLVRPPSPWNLQRLAGDVPEAKAEWPKLAEGERTMLLDFMTSFWGADFAQPFATTPPAFTPH